MSAPGTGIASRLRAWAREWLNAAPPAQAGADALAGFEARLGTLAESNGDGERSARPRLLVVLTTYARPDAAARILRELDANLAALGGTLHVTRLCVLEDASDARYDAARAVAAQLAHASVLWLQSRTHLGKPGYFRVWHAAFELARRFDADYAFFVQDDLELEPDAIARAVALVRELESERTAPGDRPAPRVLSLFSSRDDEVFGRWVFFPRRASRTLPVRQTQWFDLPAVLINKSALERLGYCVFPIDAARWQRDPNASSGVGRQLTRRLYARARIYQCAPSLVFHGREASVMNPGARADRVMDNRAERSARP